MQYYLAPMEGITNYIYRRTYHRFYPSMDKYFTPFINPHTTRSLNSKEKKDILPENNEGMYVVPQILTNQGEDFVRVAKALKEYGYEEVNLNLGCPSGTVVSKKKGAGFLEFPTRIDHFLEEVFEHVDMKVSVKTRLGLLEADEFDQLLEVYNKYPLHELIIHPRVRIDYYKNPVDLDSFERALARSKNPVCYNGDIFTLEDYKRWKESFPNVDSLMLGRGIIGNPGLLGEIQNMERSIDRESCKEEKVLLGNVSVNTPLSAETGFDKVRFKEFHDTLLGEYKDLKIGDRNVLFKMKELWHYMIGNFEDSKKPEKMIKKAQTMEKYEEAVRMLLY